MIFSIKFTAMDKRHTLRYPGRRRDKEAGLDISIHVDNAEDSHA